MKRRLGFYWVKYLGSWTICEFDGGRGLGLTMDYWWMMPGSEAKWDDNDFDEIEETPITHK